MSVAFEDPRVWLTAAGLFLTFALAVLSNRRRVLLYDVWDYLTPVDTL